MALLRIDSFEYDIGLAMFDKDGTLIDYALMWNHLAESATDSLLDAVEQPGPDLRDALLASMGLDPNTMESDPDGALAVGPNDRVYAGVESTLVQHGVKPEQAQHLVEHYFIPPFTAHPPQHAVQQVGDLNALFERLTLRDVPILVATADYRETTVRTMTELGLAHYVRDYVCADDRQHPVKHDPEALLYQGRRFSVLPEQIMMVGDTVGDLRMARAAGIGLGLGVLTGAGSRNDLSPWADLVVDSVDAIDVV